MTVRPPPSRNRCGVSGSSAILGSSVNHSAESGIADPGKGVPAPSIPDSDAEPGAFPMYPDVSISASDTTDSPVSRTTSHSLPGSRRRLVSHPSPITRGRPGEMTLRGEE